MIHFNLVIEVSDKLYNTKLEFIQLNASSRTLDLTNRKIARSKRKAYTIIPH